MRRLLLVAAACLSLSAAVAAAEPVIVGKVAYVVDGDTLQIHDTRIRLWGHDTPERDECGYRQASAALKRIVAGRLVTCQPIEIDTHGRTVAQCWTAGRDIGAAMVRAGYSRDFTRYSAGAYAAHEAAAAEERRGLWASCWWPNRY